MIPPPLLRNLANRATHENKILFVRRTTTVSHKPYDVRQRFVRFENRFVRFENRFVRFENRFVRFENRFVLFENRFVRLENRTTLKWFGDEMSFFVRRTDEVVSERDN